MMVFTNKKYLKSWKCSYDKKIRQIKSISRITFCMILSDGFLLSLFNPICTVLLFYHILQKAVYFRFDRKLMRKQHFQQQLSQAGAEIQDSENCSLMPNPKISLCRHLLLSPKPHLHWWQSSQWLNYGRIYFWETIPQDISTLWYCQRLQSQRYILSDAPPWP